MPKNISNDDASTFAWKLANHLTHFCLIVPITTIVFRGNCSLVHGMGNDGCCSMVFLFFLVFSGLKTFTHPTVVIVYIYI